MLGISVFMMVFRLLHIAIGVAWVGSVFLFVTFLQLPRPRSRRRAHCSWPSSWESGG